MPNELNPYVRQDYTCDNGELAQIIIPRSATKDDLCALMEMLEVLIERRFKKCESLRRANDEQR